MSNKQFILTVILTSIISGMIGYQIDGILVGILLSFFTAIEISTVYFLIGD